jgi:hypothetical protein
MNIVKATKKYEEWLGRHLQILQPDMRLKHARMAESEFSFFRATFYRWMQVWADLCPDLVQAPHLLSVGDLHVENFGTWRDAEGRLVWGINDFDEACNYPYTVDLVRLAASALLAVREERLCMKPKDAADSILAGYELGMEQGGRPFVLSEEHVWLRAIAENKLRDPVRFWQRLDSLPPFRGTAPEVVREALEHNLPDPKMPYRLARRLAGLGSLGRMRVVAIGEWKGGRVAREVKALAPSALHWVDPDAPAEILYASILKRAVRCPDPHVQLRGNWLVRRLSPHCSRIELDALGTARGELRLLEAMGRETANVHVGNEEKRRPVLKDLRQRKGTWLLKAAQSMAEKVDKDWQAWKRHEAPSASG